MLFRSSNGYGLLVVHIGETVYIYIVYYLPTTHRLVVYTDLCYSGVVVVYMGETVYVYISEYIWLAAIVISVKVCYKKHSAWYVDIERIITAHLTSL